MEIINQTTVQEFILLGFSVSQEKRILLLPFFSALYALALAENITIILLVLVDSHLAQLPMYILLSNFSWLEMCYVSSTVPRMISDLPRPHGIVSFQTCFLQFYIFFSLGSTESFFVSAMALDRYLAICHPLRYPQIMSPNFCYSLAGTCWIVGFLLYIAPVVLMSKLNFCGPNIIDHFLCDPGPILSLVCPPIDVFPQTLLYFMNVLVIVCMFFFILLSYGAVIVTLMKSTRQGGRKKAMSTIFYHLVVVALLYGSVIGMYITPGGENQSHITKIVTVFYTAVTPFLNPMFYCLRNDQVQQALQRLLVKFQRNFRRKVEV